MKSYGSILFFCITWLMQDGSMHGAQPSDGSLQELSREVIILPRVPDYLSIVSNEYGERSLREYPDIDSVKYHLVALEKKRRGPLWSKIKLSEWITTSGIKAYRIPTDNTVQRVVDPLIAEWLDVRSMSKPALDVYTEWMKQNAGPLVLRITRAQLDILLGACEKKTQKCLTQLETEKEKIKADESRVQALQKDISRTTRNLILGATTVTGLSVAILSYFERSKLACATSGLYASYLWWQWAEHLECMRWLKTQKEQAQKRVDQHDTSVLQLKEGIPQQMLTKHFEELYRESLVLATRKIESYRRQEDRKLEDWSRAQKNYCDDEEVQLIRAQEDFFVERQNIMECCRQGPVQSVQQPLDVLSQAHEQQAAQIIVPVSNRRDWRSAGKFLVSAVVQKLKKINGE